MSEAFQNSLKCVASNYTMWSKLLCFLELEDNLINMDYGQFCPVAKATEIIGEKWTVLIIRELLMGGSRFNELQRGLSLISPTLLSKRLDTLVEKGLVVKKRIPGQKGYEYFPTDSCQQLLPIIRQLGDWGMEWARSNLSEKDYDVEFLMLYLKRSIDTAQLVGHETIIRFKFTDFSSVPDWWMVITGDEIDLCDKDPGKNVDIYFTTTVKTMADIWMGKGSYQQSIKTGDLTVVGDKYLINSITRWMKNSIFKNE